MKIVVFRIPIKKRMKYNYYLLLIFMSLTSIASAQQFSISGRLVDAENKSPLEAATVFAETVTDSSMVTYTISDADGKFELKGRSGHDVLNVYVSFVGYTPFEKKVDLSKSKEIVLNDIPLELQIESLGDVIIKARRPPVRIKKDTLEFNADSFKTAQGANVEDLLKELPGVDIDPDGQITINGKPVNEILVNGKPFFSGDPTVTTRTLTKEMVDKIQVSDTKSKSEAFTGEMSDGQNKSINITIKKERSRGVFGRATLGGGTDKRFEYAGLFTYMDFSSGLQLSALGAGNNINVPGFSYGEIEKMFGNARNVNFGGGQGITNSRTGGFNYGDDYGKNTEISTDYLYSAGNSYNDSYSQRENILPTNRYFSESSSSSVNSNDNHRVNTRFETKIDSTWFIEVRPEFSYNERYSRYNREEETRDENRDLTNESTSNSNGYNTGRNFSNDLNITRNYGSKGGFFRVSIDNRINEDRNDGYNNSVTEIYGDEPETIVRDQYTDGESGSMNYSLNGQWRIPVIAEKLFVSAEYRFRKNRQEDQQSVYDFDTDANGYTIFNPDQSTDFTNTNQTSRPELGIQYTDRESDMRIRANVAYLNIKLDSDDAIRNIQFDNTFDAIEARANIRKRFSEKASIYADYNLRNDAPSVYQLSPFVNISNPLNIRTGNPNLVPESSHSMYFYFNNYDWQARSGFNIGLNAEFNNNSVISKSTIDPNTFERTTTYTNVDGRSRMGAYGGYSKNIELDTVRSLRVSLNMSASTNRNINFNNEVLYASRTTSYSPSLNVDFTWRDVMEFRPNYNVSFSKNSFDLESRADQRFVRHELGLSTSTTIPKSLEWRNDIRYITNPNVAAGFNKSAVFWNASLTYTFFKENALATLKVYDLLKQNTNARRMATQDYIEDVQSTVLQQYFMFSLTYKFNTLGQKGEVRESRWRRY